MKIRNLNMNYAARRLPKAGEIWKGKPYVGGLYLIVETGDHFGTDGKKKHPSKLSAVDLDWHGLGVGTYEGQDDWDGELFIEGHDFVCDSDEVELVFPKRFK